MAPKKKKGAPPATAQRQRATPPAKAPRKVPAKAPAKSAALKKAAPRAAVKKKPRTSVPARKRVPPPSPPPPPPRSMSPQVVDPLERLVCGGREERLSDVLLALARDRTAAAPPSGTDQGKRKKQVAATGVTTARNDLAYLQAAPRATQCVCAEFLATVSHHLLMLCCRTTQHLALRTGKAFLAVAPRGRTPPPPGSEDARDDPHQTHASLNGGAEAKAARDRQADAAQELVYRTVRSTIAASCALGHRSCQAIWGPRGCGKHRLLRLIAADCARQPGTLVLQLHGDLLRSDAAALRVVADQLLVFLRSPQSAELRAADPNIASGQIDFGVLFHFPARLSAMADAEAAAAQPRRTAAGVDGGDRRVARARPDDGGGDNDGGEEDIDDDEDDEEEDDAMDAAEEAKMLISSTTAYLAGGAASALSALQRALLLFKSHGVNIVVCLRHADQFGIWCDQLFYVLSGLMHEGDERGGGLSLVLSSSAPDIRQLEKRLSSRLTCETQYIPLLPWTPRRLVRANVSLLSDFFQCQLAQLQLADRRLDLEHGEEALRQLASAQPGKSEALRPKKRGKTATAAVATTAARDSVQTLFQHVDREALRRLEHISASLASAVDSLEGLLPEGLLPLQWLQWLAHVQRPLLDVADSWLRRQRSAEARAAVGTRGLGQANQRGLPGGRDGGLFSASAIGLWGLGWRAGRKRVRPRRESGEMADATLSPDRRTEATASEQEFTGSAEDDNSIVEDLTPSEASDDETANDSMDVRAGGMCLQAVPQAPSPALDSVASLLGHPTLTLELLIVLCEKLLDELVPGAADIDDDAETTLAHHVHTHTAAQLAEGATAPESLAAAASCLTAAVSGAAPLLSSAGVETTLAWLSARLALDGTMSTRTAATTALPFLEAAVAGPGRRLQDLWDAGEGEEVAPPFVSSASAWQKLSARSPVGLRLLPTPLTGGCASVPTRVRTQWQHAVQARLGPAPSLQRHPPSPSATLLPPGMYDLLDDGHVVRLEYLTREAFLVLFYVYQQQSGASGRACARSVGDLLEDVASSLGTRAAAALDRDAFRAAIHQLARWQLLQLSVSARQASDAHMTGGHRRSGGGGGGGGAAGHRDGEVVTLCGSKGRLQEFLRLVLDKHIDWCEDVLGLSSKDHMHMRSLV